MPRLIKRWPLSAGLMLILALAGILAARIMIADVLFFNVERDVVYWGTNNQKPTENEVTRAQAGIGKALQFWPRNPDYLAMAARLQAWQGQIAGNQEAANGQFRLAMDTMYQSLLERPGNPYSWAQYAEYVATQPGKRLELVLAIEKAKRLGPGDASLQKRVQAILARYR